VIQRVIQGYNGTQAGAAKWLVNKPQVQKKEWGETYMTTVTQKDETIKTNGEFRFPRFLVLGAVAGLFLASRSGEETRKYLRDRSHKSLDYVKDQATKLRRTAEALVEAAKKLMACRHQPVQTDTEAERRSYEEQRRETLGDKMKINHFEKDISPLGFLAHESWSGAAELMRGLLTRSPVCGSKMSYWQFILLQSKANGCLYHDKDLPQNNWAWPKLHGFRTD
jgi:gas vesicle protein